MLTATKNSDTKIDMDIQEVLQPGTPGYERCQKLKERIVSVVPQLGIERARFVTEAYRETENDSAVIRRAKVFKKILENVRVYILDDELIVGKVSETQRSAPIFPEFGVEWIADEIDTFYTRAQDKFFVPEHVKQEFFSDILPYWKGKTMLDRVNSTYSEELKLQRFDASVFAIGLHEGGGLAHVFMDYEKVIKVGIKGIKAEVQEKLDQLDIGNPKNLKKKEFYDACIIVCDACITFAHRYADEARRMAANESDPVRQHELLQIAENCDFVPENPAETLFQALQSFWFAHLFPHLNDNGTSYTPGRWDQYMYPYYEKDILEGRLTKAQAQELIEATWVNFPETVKIYNEVDASVTAGQPNGNNVCIGGVTPKGKDATNDFSYRCLEAHSHIGLGQPNFTVRLHKKTPYELLMRSCEVIKQGSGMPQFVNDEIFVNSMLNLGTTLEEARDYGVVGCVEIMPRNVWGRANGGYFNLPKMIEFVLSNGKCMVTGKQVAPKTGEPEVYQTFEDVLEGYRQQLEYSVRLQVIANNTIDMIHEELAPVPYVSLLVGDCVENGTDVTGGGARYNWTGPLGIGTANIADSLMAIKKAVFEDKKVTMRELADAVNSDFEGQEELRLYLQNKVPKYGNDIPEVDELAKLGTNMYFDELAKYENYRGGKFNPALLPVSSYVAFGATTGATPDGRKHGTPLADGISPQNGMDRNGPTAVFKSVTTLDHLRCGNGVVFNQKLNPGPLQGKEGMKKFADLVRSYMNMGGCHIQFNIISADTLREAQQNPEKHKDLVVRVAGYSAFFNELSKDIQDSIITRTEQAV